MSKSKKKGDDYYPLRWKAADFVENIIILHRTRAALLIAALGIMCVILGLILVGWRPWSSGEETATEEEVTEQVVEEDPVEEVTTIRPLANDVEVAGTTAGTVIELGPTTMRLTGGFSDDVAADVGVARAIELFTDREFLDAQLLGPFSDDGELTIRIVEPLFIGDTADVNPDLAFLFSDVAAAVLSSGEWTVEVVGHAPDDALSQTRALTAADQLIAEGVVANIVTSRGAGSSERILDFQSRIDFILTR